MTARSSLRITQQWQYVDPIPPELLKPEAFERCREIGIDSLQSYVTWAEIEKQPGVVDFSAYDVLVEKLLKTELLWTPFLILGPYYATPAWFRESDRSVFARCLEHDTDSGIQSIWNPHLLGQVERFIGLFHEHYKSVPLAGLVLGPSGNWGEALYPADGGFHGVFHTHPGWWCNDRFAQQSYRCREMPVLPSAGTQSEFSWGRFVPGGVRRFLSPLAREFRVKRPYLRKYKPPLADVSTGSRDFIDWYVASMTQWEGSWIETARSFFPETRIVVATGGDGNPMLGANFAEQVRVAAKYGCGVRITNLTDDYASSFSLSGLTAAASRFYDTYFSTEEAGVNSARGVAMRLFDAVASGAEEAYFKGLIDLRTGEITESGRIVKKYRPALNLGKPKLGAAVLFPSKDIAFQPHQLAGFHYLCEGLRRRVEFDLVEETMIQNGALNIYRFLVILDEEHTREPLWKIIFNWIGDGGVVLMPKAGKLKDFEKIANGYLLPLKGSAVRSRRLLNEIAEALRNTDRRYPWQGIRGSTDARQGTYAAELVDGRVVRYKPRTGDLELELPS